MHDQGEHDTKPNGFANGCVESPANIPVTLPPSAGSPVMDAAWKMADAEPETEDHEENPPASAAAAAAAPRASAGGKRDAPDPARLPLGPVGPSAAAAAGNRKNGGGFDGGDDDDPDGGGGAETKRQFNRRALQPGDMIDVQDDVGVWSEAEVIEVSTRSAGYNNDDGSGGGGGKGADEGHANEACSVRVHYVFWEPKFDEWIDVDSNRVAARGSHVFLGHDARTGDAVRVGQRVDAFDIHPAHNKWMQAQIVELDEDQQQLKLHWWNWHVKFDEWLPFTSRRLAPYGRHTRKRHVDWQRHRLRSESYYGDDDDGGGGGVFRVGSKDGGGRSKRRRLRQGSDFRDADKENRSQSWASLSGGDARFRHYCFALQAQGLSVRDAQGDGNCLFRSVSHQVYVRCGARPPHIFVFAVSHVVCRLVSDPSSRSRPTPPPHPHRYGTEDHHALIRQRCIDYMEIEAAYFSNFIVGDQEEFEAYLAHKRQNGIWGDDPELQAMCEMYDKPAHVYVYHPQEGAQVLRRMHATASTSQTQPLRLSFYGGGHYDSIVGEDHRTHVTSQEPGALELRALERARARSQRGISARGGAAAGGPAYAAGGGDAALDAALRASRVAWDNQGGLDMSAAYEASLASLGMSEEQMLAAAVEASKTEQGGAGASMQSDIDRAIQASLEQPAQKEADEAALLAKAIAESLQAGQQGGGGGGGAMSEEAQLKWAMEQSAQAQGGAEADIEAARQQSILEASRRAKEDADLQAALAASRAGGAAGATKGQDAEDALMQQALAASMVSSGGGEAPSQLQQVLSASGAGAEDVMLQQALAASMRK